MPTSWRPGARRRCVGWRASGVSCGAPAASWRRCIARPAGWPGWIWRARARRRGGLRPALQWHHPGRRRARLRAGAAGGQAGAGQGAFRCAAAGRLGHAAGHGGRDEHGRGQDADRHAAGRHGGAGRAAGACHHHQRLSGRARRADHDAAVSGAGPERGLGQYGNGSCRAAAGLSGRHRVLLEQDPGLRLSARPDRAGRRQGRGPAAAGTAARRRGARRRAVPARPVLRHRGRGRQRAGRRGAHAAHHFGRAGRGRRRRRPGHGAGGGHARGTLPDPAGASTGRAHRVRARASAPGLRGPARALGHSVPARRADPERADRAAPVPAR